MTSPTVIDLTAGEIAAELRRQGIGPDERVTLTINPELFPGRRESRKLVIAAGLTDEDIDRLIEQAREEVAHPSNRWVGRLGLPWLAHAMPLQPPG